MNESLSIHSFSELTAGRAGLPAEPGGQPAPPLELRAQLEEICIEAGGRSFAEGKARERAQFLDKWLGRYLRHWPELAMVAVDLKRGAGVGYCVGCAHDAAGDERFADIGYFPLIAKYTPEFPAHLHINVEANWRGRHVGAALIERFAGIAAVHGASGLHVVTGAASPNRAFYRRAGFREIVALDWNEASIVMLGRPLPAARGLSSGN